MSRKIIALLLAALLCVCALTGCAGKQEKSAEDAVPAEETAPAGDTAPEPAETPEEPETETPAEESPEEPAAAVTVTDMTGREITLEEPATRVVALSAADCEVLCALGCGDTLVGRGEYCNWPEEILGVPVVQSGTDTNIEQIIALKPQVLLMSTMAQTEEQVKALEDAGIRVVVSDAMDIEGIYTSVGIIGTLMGKEADAAEIVDGMKTAFADLKAKADAYEGEQMSVYFEISPLEWGLWTAGTGTFYNEIAEMLNLKNVFDDVSYYGEISEEQVIERKPDAIVTISMYYGEGPTPVEEILSRPGWDVIPAVANEKILNLQNDELSRPAPRLAEGAQMLYDFMYGE